MITAEQRQLRQSFIGSSDAPAVLGVDPYRTVADLFMDKTGRVDRRTSEAADRGNLLEPVVLQWAAKELGVEIQTDQFVTHPDWPRLCANMDALIVGRRAGLEAKTTVLCEEWGDAYTDQVPERVIVQTHQQMLLKELDMIYVPVLMPKFRRFSFEMFVVTRDDALAQHIGKQGTEFYETFIVPDVAPPRILPSIDTLKHLKRLPGASIEIPAGIVAEWLEARAIAKAADEAKELKQQALLAAIGEAETGTFPGGEVTYKATTRKSYTVAEATYRTLRHKAAKEA